MSRRLAGHRRPRPQDETATRPLVDQSYLAKLEHDTGLVEVGAHGIDVPCLQCLGHRPDDNLKRVRRQLALTAAEASGREHKLIHAMGDALPIRVLYMDGQPAPQLPALELDAAGELVVHLAELDPATLALYLGRPAIEAP